MTVKKSWIAVALIGATLLAYVPALRAPFVMDDESAIAESVAPAGSVPAGSPVAGRPVVRLSLAANYALNALLGIDQRRDPDGPNKAVGFRLFNIFFHLCTGALLFGLMRRTMRERPIPRDWRNIADPLAAVVCTIWLLHPIQTEAVDYVVQRTELLASLFYVATLYASLRAWDATTAPRRVGWYVVGILACALGVGSKEIAVSAPLAVVLYDRAFRLAGWRALRRPGNGRGWFYLALAATCAAVFAFVAIGGRGNTAGFGGITWYAYLYTQCWAIAHYLWLVLWPNALVIDYGEKLVTGGRGIPGAVLLVLFALATLAAWRKLPKYGWFAFLGTEFFLLLGPSSSFVPVRTEIAAERRIYLALVNVLLIAVVGTEWLRRKYFSSVSALRLGLATGGLAIVLAAATAARSHTYATSEGLWRDAVAKVPDNPRAKVNLGHALATERPPKYAEAEAVLRGAIAQDTSCRHGCAQLAAVLAAQGRTGEAIALLEHTLASEPDDIVAEGRLAFTQMKAGSFEPAIGHLRHMASTHPSEHLLVVLGVANLAIQHQQDALVALQAASDLNPGDHEVTTLGNSLFQAGRNKEALPFLKELAINLAQDMQ
ncbi:MAG TPA: tetratricopeptide repeat protein [Gemmatimonadaceae bacterium]|nr:tetratricopeptide repeat protein [Gemmatimonadaceae bacterium]